MGVFWSLYSKFNATDSEDDDNELGPKVLEQYAAQVLGKSNLAYHEF